MRDRHGQVSLRGADGWVTNLRAGTVDDDGGMGITAADPDTDWATMWRDRGPIARTGPYGLPLLLGQEVAQTLDDLDHLATEVTGEHAETVARVAARLRRSLDRYEDRVRRDLHPR